MIASCFVFSQQTQALPGGCAPMTENELTQAEIAGGIFRPADWGSKTPGHPEYGVTPGVEWRTA
jgi:transketolase